MELKFPNEVHKIDLLVFDWLSGQKYKLLETFSVESYGSQIKIDYGDLIDLTKQVLLEKFPDQELNNYKLQIEFEGSLPQRIKVIILP